MNAFWESLSQRARASLIASAIVIVLASVGAAWWLLRPEYAVLFSELKAQDAGVMTAELEKLKIPYQIEDNGTTIAVDKSQVHTTRLKLMGKDLPLHGAIGFELFNNTDFGMTDFAQKINYQRTLQGELTRTILALSEVKDVRVHLALAEQGLFKQVSAKSKAAVTLTMREGQALRPEQVSGVQRLVAAATPGMTPQDVTVVDAHGVALTRSSDELLEVAQGAGGSGGSSRLDLKKETEALLMRKAGAVLDRAFGPGQAIVSVDVTLNMDQVRTTTEDIIPATSNSGENKGVVVKERGSVREVVAPPLEIARSGNPSPTGTTQREVEYQVGRRVEQVVGSVGSVRSIYVVAVVRQKLDKNQEEQVRRLLAAAVGASIDRGDTVVVQSLHALAIDDERRVENVNSADGDVRIRAVELDGNKAVGPLSFGAYTWVAMVLALAALVLIVFRKRTVNAPQADQLSEADRAAVLAQVRAWMDHPSNGGVPPPSDVVARI
jgi:flagellar M-ring protein FliF